MREPLRLLPLLLLLCALLLAAAPGLQASPRKVLREGELTVGVCKRSSDCVIAVPSGCCDSCAGEPVAILKGTSPNPACGCALKEQFDAPPCPPVSPASRFRAVCKQQRCVRAPAAIKK